MKIVVLAGGISSERDVSLSSGRMIYTALKERGYQTVLLDVFLGCSLEGSPEEAFSGKTDLTGEIRGVGLQDPDIEAVKAMRADGSDSFFGPNVIEVCQAADVVFLALHGENGENGKLQACFDLLGIRYTGTDYLSSALCMDKGLAKELMQHHGIPTPAGICLRRGEDPGTEAKVPFPCVVKVCNGGSSVGVYMVNREEEYRAALEEGFRYDTELIVEQYIKGREFSVGVMDGKALPVIEIAPLQGFYDYKNKYQAGSTVETCPARLSEEKTREMQQLAEQVFRALRLKNYARKCMNILVKIRFLFLLCI